MKTMAAVILITIIGIVMIVSSIIEFNQNIQRIKELEERLDKYYKEREQKLKDKGLIK